LQRTKYRKNRILGKTFSVKALDFTENEHALISKFVYAFKSTVLLIAYFPPLLANCKKVHPILNMNGFLWGIAFALKNIKSDYWS